jgi:hypothetical protein
MKQRVFSTNDRMLAPMVRERVVCDPTAPNSNGQFLIALLWPYLIWTTVSIRWSGNERLCQELC